MGSLSRSSGYIESFTRHRHPAGKHSIREDVMQQQGLASAVMSQHEIAPAAEGGKLHIPQGFLTPGFITAATSLGHTYRVTDIEFADPGSHQVYFSALQVPFMLFGTDDFAMARPNRGLRYSPMQMLENAGDVDRATTETTDCLRHHTGDLPSMGRVAIACRLKISELGKNIEEEPLSDDVQSILDDLTF